MARDLRYRNPRISGNRNGGRITGIPGHISTPGVGQYQAPGTSGMTDFGLGMLYEDNPEWFGGESGWGSLDDIYDSWNLWESYLQGGTTDIDIDWEQQEAGWNWWNAWNPEESSEWSWQNVNYANREPVFTGSATNPNSFSSSAPFSGGGNIGGSGDLGTGSGFAGGSMYNTLTGGGLWDYDCDLLGPSYNSAGVCIACCD